MERFLATIMILSLIIGSGMILLPDKARAESVFKIGTLDPMTGGLSLA